MSGPTQIKASRRKAESPTAPKELSLATGAFLILIATFIAFGPALSAGFIWDDNDMLTENHLIRGTDGLRRIWAGEFVDYFPLTMSTLWIEWRLWGMKATGYHVTNILLHALTAVLLWRLLLRLKVPGAFWGAALFAVHPVNVESVAWITERKNTLCLFFAAIATYSFIRAEVQDLRPLTKDQQRRWYLFSIAAFALSLLAKTASVMLPFVFLGIIWWRGQNKVGQSGARRLAFADLLRVAPFFLIAGALALVTIWFQYNRAIEHTVVNETTFAERIIIAGRAVWFYLGKALFPVQLTFVYPRWQVNAASIPQFLPAVAVALAGVFLFFLRKKWGYSPLLAFGYFVLTLFPVLGFFNIYFQRYSFVADHWQYLSIIGVTVFVGALLTRLLKDNATFALGSLALVMAFLTFQQAKIYKNQETLWRDTLRKNPTCSMAEANLGLYLANQGRRDEAISHYERALNLNPKDDSSWFNWGVSLLEAGQPVQAVEKFQETLKVNADNKHALMSLAWLRSIHKDPGLRNGAEAVQLAERGVEVTKGNDEWMLDTLAAAYAESGRFEDAIRTENKAIELATRKSMSEAVAEMQSRLRLYEAGKPFHEK